MSAVLLESLCQDLESKQEGVRSDEPAPDRSYIRAQRDLARENLSRPWP